MAWRDGRSAGAWERRVQALPGGDLLLVAPRLLRFVAGSVLASRHPAGAPAPRPTLGLVAGAALDELIASVFRTTRPGPRPEELGRIAAEVRQALAVYEAEGWGADPRAFHRDPPPPSDPVLRPGLWGRLRYERLSFESGYVPHPRLPGGERWLGYERNRRACAYVLRHRGGPRPWLVCLHGFGRGWPSDLGAFRSRLFHLRDGLNVLLPVFPLHGPRRQGRSGEGVIGYDAMNNVNGLAQAVWDVRRCLRWAREQGATSVVLHGTSLGAWTAALLAAVEDGLDGVVAGIPVVDLVRVLRRHTPAPVRELVEGAGLLGEEAEAVHAVVAPLRFPPRLPPGRLFVYAGLGDRLAGRGQALALWEHWGRPRILWFPSSHVGFLWTGEVWRFVEEAVGALLRPPR